MPNCSWNLFITMKWNNKQIICLMWVPKHAFKTIYSWPNQLLKRKTFPSFHTFSTRIINTEIEERKVLTAKLFRISTKIVYYVPRRTMRFIARQATMLEGDRSRGAISPASIVANVVISRILCIGTYYILCASSA